jgi:RHS repeat-associated protein
VDQILAQDDGASHVSWLLADELGSIRDVVTSAGAEVDHLVYGAFGNLLSQTNSAAAPRYQFAGREFDPATGLYFDRARYYSPVTGRFLTEDPIAFQGGQADLYAYVGDNPVNFTDPSGLNAGRGNGGRGSPATGGRGGFPVNPGLPPATPQSNAGGNFLTPGANMNYTPPDTNSPGYGGNPGNNTPGYNSPGYNTPGYGTPGSSTPGSGTPGSSTPGYNTPGSSTPGYSTPGYSTPGEGTPGYNTPGYNTPGDNTPGYNTPGYDTPGYNTPGTNSPGDNTPGYNTPGYNTPGTNTPGYNTPGENTPGSNTPGSNTPGSNSPGGENPGPGSETPGTTPGPSNNNPTSPSNGGSGGDSGF